MWQGLVIANSAGLFTLFGWLIGVTYAAGQRAKQMDVNTEAIKEIRERGSPGVRERFDSIKERLDGISREQSAQRKILDRLSDRSSAHGVIQTD